MFEIEPSDRDDYISYQTLVKNNGFFKSAKQAAFILRYIETCSKNVADSVKSYNELATTYAGVTIKDGECCRRLTGMYSWASFGTRSQVPTVITFVFDKYGVVRKYKTGGHGNLREGWSPDPAKCKLEWERPADAVIPEYLSEAAQQKQVEQKPTSAWVGLVGNKISVKVTIKSVRYCGQSKWGSMWLTVGVTPEGNVIKVWKQLGDEEQLVGREVTLQGTVKTHEEFRGTRDTVLTRVKLIP